MIVNFVFIWKFSSHTQNEKKKISSPKWIQLFFAKNLSNWILWYCLFILIFDHFTLLPFTFHFQSFQMTTKVKQLTSKNLYEPQKWIHKMRPKRFNIYTTAVTKSMNTWRMRVSFIPTIIHNWSYQMQSCLIKPTERCIQSLCHTFHHTTNQKWAKGKVDVETHRSGLSTIYILYIYVFYLVQFIYIFNQPYRISLAFFSSGNSVCDCMHLQVCVCVKAFLCTDIIIVWCTDQVFVYVSCFVSVDLYFIEIKLENEIR